MSAQGQFQDEIANVIKRYCEESDLTVAEVIGVLEVTKWNLLTANEPADDAE